jgi:hypothetical protein
MSRAQVAFARTANAVAGSSPGTGSGGAEDIEQAEGEWHDGDWLSFDPVAEPHQVAA